MPGDVVVSLAFVIITFLMISSAGCFVIFYAATYLFKRNVDFTTLLRYCSLVGVVLAILFMAFYPNEDL